MKEYLATLDDAAFGAAKECNPEVRVAVRPSGAMDRGDAVCLPFSPMPIII